METELFRHKTEECRKDRREKQGEERSTKPFAAIDTTHEERAAVSEGQTAAQRQLRDSPAAPGPRCSSRPGQMRNPIAQP